MLKLLITGGLGYIGSHIVAQLDERYCIKIVDDLSNTDSRTMGNLRDLIGDRFSFDCIDVRNEKKMIETFRMFKPSIVLHLAGKKSVPESVSDPLKYYQHNLLGTMSVLSAMDAVDCKNILFSSSATVYGNPKYLPVDEIHPTNPTNPYGMSKLMSEKIITDWCNLDIDRKAICLRYFNPLGSHTSGTLFESGPQRSTNLMPTLLDVVAGKTDIFTIFGDSFKTSDGTGVRDYIHVVDLAEAHIISIEKIFQLKGNTIYNVGNGSGISVRELITAFEDVNNVKIPVKVEKKRVGDTSEIFASAEMISKDLGWKAKKTLAQMCADSWNACDPKNFK